MIYQSIRSFVRSTRAGLLALGLSGALLGQAPPSNVTVTVLDPGGTAVQGAIVVADFLLDGQLLDHQMAFADGNGEVSFLAPGSQDEISLAAMEPGFSSVMEVHGPDATTVQLQL